MKTIQRSLFLLAMVLAVPCDTAAAPPGQPLAPLRLRLSADTVEVFGRVDIAVEGVPSAGNPFDPDEIAVDAEIVPPSGALYRLPGYYHADYERNLAEGREVLNATGEKGWRVRFAPIEVGRHTVTVSVEVQGKSVASGKASLMSRAGSRHGFIRVDEEGRRYFRFDDGTPLFLNGLCVCWHDRRGTYDYDSWLPAYERAGMNYIRIWMWPHAFGIEWDRGDRTRYRLDRAWTLDRVLAEADRHGICVMLCLDYHGILEIKKDFFGGNNYWPRHPYNASNGGPCANQNEFFTSQEARTLYRKRLRYIVARWSSFSNLLAWQFFNEVDNVYRYLKPEDVVAWHRDLGRYLRSIDPYRHLITTSLTGRSERREIWELPEMDFAQYHSYNEKHPAEMTAGVVRRFHERYGKPIFVGEYGTDFRGWKPKTDPQLRALHQAVWSGAFSGAAGTGMSWWWQSLHRAERYGTWTSLSSFLRGTGIGRGNLAPASFEKVAGHDVKIFGLKGEREALVWLLDPRYSWPTGALETEPAVRSDARVVLVGLRDGRYSMEWWDTLRGKLLKREDVRVEAGRLELSAPPFQIDVAARIRSP